MNRAFLLTALTLALSLTLGMGCLGEAPHDNPLDPNSDRFATEGEVAGRVADRADEPLSEAEVRLILASSGFQTERVTQTNAQGAFEMTAVLEAAGYRLLVSKEGYGWVARTRSRTRRRAGCSPGAGVGRDRPTKFSDGSGLLPARGGGSLM